MEVFAFLAAFLVFIGLTFVYTLKPPKNPDGKMPKAWLSFFLPLALCHPSYPVLAWLVCDGQGWGQKTGLNVFLVSGAHFFAILMFIAFARFAIFYLLHRLGRGTWCFWDTVAAFSSANLWCVLSFPLLFMWLEPVEMNIGGMIYLPITIIAVILLGPTVFFRQVRWLRHAPKRSRDVSPA